MSILVAENLFNRVLLFFRRFMAKFRMKRKEAVLFEEFWTVIKQDLAKIERYTMDKPKELQVIGWDTMAKAQPLDPPGIPRYLETVYEGKGTIELDWKRPASVSGGPVNSYIILRRDKPAPGQPFGPWQETQAAIQEVVGLTNQPRGIDLEYRIVAVNETGNSAPSNTVAAVL